MAGSEDIALRPASAGDAEFVYRITEACMRGYAEQTWGQWDEERARSSFNPATQQIIQYEKRDVGVLECTSDSEHVGVESLYILHDCQNRGIGTHLMRRLMNDARRAQKSIYLTVLVVNPARRFYERLGFVVVKSTPERHQMMWDWHDQDVPKNPKKMNP